MIDMEKVKYRILKRMTEKYGNTRLDEAMEIAEMAEAAFLGVHLEEMPTELDLTGATIFTPEYKKLMESGFDDEPTEEDIETSFIEDVKEGFRLMDEQAGIRYEGDSDDHKETDPLKLFRLKDQTFTPDEYKQIDEIEKLEG